MSLVETKVKWVGGGAERLNYHFPTVPKTNLGATFSAKEMTFWFPAFVRNSSRSRPGRDLAPKTLQGRIFIDLGSFSGRFWMDFNNFRRTFNATFQNFIAVYDIDGVTILAPIQIMWPGGVRASRLNTARPGEGRRPC